MIHEQCRVTLEAMAALSNQRPDMPLTPFDASILLHPRLPLHTLTPTQPISISSPSTRTLMLLQHRRCPRLPRVSSPKSCPRIHPLRYRPWRIWKTSNSRPWHHRPTAHPLWLLCLWRLLLLPPPAILVVRNGHWVRRACYSELSFKSGICGSQSLYHLTCARAEWTWRAVREPGAVGLLEGDWGAMV